MENFLKQGWSSAPERVKQTTWRQFLKAHWDGLIAADFFTSEVLSWRGLVVYYILFVIELLACDFNKPVSAGLPARNRDGISTAEQSGDCPAP